MDQIRTCLCGYKCHQGGSYELLHEQECDWLWLDEIPHTDLREAYREVRGY